MILPDVNVLIHAHNLDSPVHEGGQAMVGHVSGWERRCGSSLGDHAWIHSHHDPPTHSECPLHVQEVNRRLDSWLEQPHVHIPQPSDKHFSRLQIILNALGTAGKVTTDAHLATLAMERGYTLYSTDQDFGRFKGLKWINPLTP